MANWWDGLDPDTKQALVLAGAGTASGYFNNRAEEGRQDDVRRDSAITNQAEGIQAVDRAEAGDFQFGANRNDSNAATAARMAGNSPLQFQGDRARMSALRDVLGGAGATSFTGMPGRYAKHMPSGMRSKPFSAETMNFMSSPAMAASEQPYWAAQQNIDPRLKSPDLGAMGYGAPGTAVTNNLEGERTGRLAEGAAASDAYTAGTKTRRDALMAALGGLGPDDQEEQKSGGGKGSWLKKAALLGGSAAAGYYLGR